MSRFESDSEMRNRSSHVTRGLVFAQPDIRDLAQQIVERPGQVR